MEKPGFFIYNHRVAPSRILILYAEAGAGHRRAAEALATALNERGATVTRRDAMQLAHPVFRAVYVGGGLNLITRHPQLYHFGYRLTDVPAINHVLRGPRLRAQRLSTPRLFHTITTFQPELVICTHFLPAELCASWRRSGQLTIPLCTVVTDFDPHFLWQHDGTDRYCVPTDEARARLIHDGIDPAIIHVTGIPIEAQFAHQPDRLAAAQRVLLDPGQPVVLIMGGGLGVGAMEAIARSLLVHPLDAQIVFITGSNHDLRRKLKAMSRPWIVRGFVANMPDWLAVADVAISKAGGLAASELLASGVPTIIPRGLTGHETMNAAYFASTGAALLVDSAAGALAQADRLLRDPIARATMRRSALQAARPDAAALIADLTLHAAQHTARNTPVGGDATLPLAAFHSA